MGNRGQFIDRVAEEERRREREKARRVDSASDDRTANNAVRHTYRVLTDAEKAQMVAIKDKGAEFLKLIMEIDGSPISPGSRELFIAHQKIEEAVMWAVKHITA